MKETPGREKKKGERNDRQRGGWERRDEGRKRDMYRGGGDDWKEKGL